MQAIQFKIVLRDIKPTIWRRILVPDDYSFWDLHVAIQDAMGWEDQHLHVFRIHDPSREDPEDGPDIGIPSRDHFLTDSDYLPGWEFGIADYFTEFNRVATYEYDFGDGWTHDIVFEKIVRVAANRDLPCCVAGTNACPPEDCGGPPSFQELRDKLPTMFKRERVLFRDPEEELERILPQP